VWVGAVAVLARADGGGRPSDRGRRPDIIRPVEAQQLWIPVRDGIRLAASLYLPPGSGGPWPVVLEARPYRKDDCTAGDATWYQRFAIEGDLAAVRVDLRGTGSSEGIAVDEYPPQEQADLIDVIAWLARQRWCSGRVGMFGKSYSGFNAIQVAIERPPALAAIVAIYATDDRYTDDVHYGGGARRGLDLLDYPTYMVAMNALPPVPALAGPDWRDRWAERVLETPPWLLRWLAEPTDGPYWRHGSLRPGYDRIECATMIVAGWSDAYRNATFRMFEGLQAPRRLLIGPWSHMRPESSVPGPRVDIVPELIRWWDRWLRGRDTGVDQDPPITIFVRRPGLPDPTSGTLPGSWRFEPVWPPQRAGWWDLTASSAAVRQASTWLPEASAADGADELTVRGDAGLHAPAPGADAPPWGLPEEQTPEEAHSLVYEWPVGEGPRELLGYARLELEVRASAPIAQLGVRLCDVLPDGSLLLVTRGVLNLTHRDSHSDPRPLSPGELVRVTLELDAAAYVFEPGHRVRLLLMGADWPSVWPPPAAARLGVVRGTLQLRMPVVEGLPAISVPPHFPGPPLSASGSSPIRASHELPAVWRSEHDVVGGETRFVIDHGAETTLRSGTRIRERTWGTVAVNAADPARAWADARARFDLSFPEAQVASEAHVRVDTDAVNQVVTIELVVSEAGVERWRRRWQRRSPRGLA